MIVNNLHTPLLILASPRTGSTALGKYFLNYFPTATYFFDPDYGNHNPSYIKKFIDKIKTNDPDFIVKTLYYRMDWYSDDIKNFLLSSATSKVRIRRRDVVSQTASFYISMYRNWKFHYFDKNSLDIADTIPVKDDQNMDYVIKEILNANKKINECNLQFDLDLYYEDLPSLDETGHNKTPKPLNYDEIKFALEKKLNQ
jgi:hypothetical protein